MGFVLARDFLAAFPYWSAGKVAPLKVRELCGRCVLRWNAIANAVAGEPECLEMKSSL
jgi:hypothetical protein